MRIVLDTNNILAALRRVSVLANPNRPLIKFAVHSDAVFVSSKTPDFGDRVNTEFINGLVDVGGKMVMLFDVDNFMKHPDIYEEPTEQS